MLLTRFWVKRDICRRLNFEKSMFFRVFLNVLKTYVIRLFKVNMLIPKKVMYFTRIRNYCWVTGRRRSVYKNFGVSRHIFKGISFLGVLPGLKKSSW